VIWLASKKAEQKLIQQALPTAGDS